METNVPAKVAATIWSALEEIPEEDFKNGRTAAYWHILSTLDNHTNKDSEL